MRKAGFWSSQELTTEWGTWGWRRYRAVALTKVSCSCAKNIGDEKKSSLLAGKVLGGGGGICADAQGDRISTGPTASSRLGSERHFINVIEQRTG